MNSRERLRRCYCHEETDRPAVYSRTNYPDNDPTYAKLKDYLEKYSDIKRIWNGRACEKGYNYEQTREKISSEYERIKTILHTPMGDLESLYLNSLAGKPGMHETYFIKDADDIGKYLSLPMPEVAGDVISFFECDREIGERGIVDVFFGCNPAGSVAELCGSENFAMLTVTDRELIHELCSKQMSVILNSVKYLLSNGVGPYFSMSGEEYIVPPVHSPVDFFEFNVKYDKPIIDLIHDSNGRMHIHCHGALKKVMQGFLDMGADVLHPIEPPTMGDISAKDAKAILRGKVCIEGNIQISKMYESTPSEIIEETEELIKDAFDDHQGLIISPTASPYMFGRGEACFPQYKAMVDTVLEV